MSQINSVLPKIAPMCIDMWEHFPTLRRLASECQSVVEMGVRGGCSAYALAAGLEMSQAKDKWMLYLDINACQNPKLEELVKSAGFKIEFAQVDSRTIELAECDLLFIDTLHTYGQLSTELTLHHTKAKKYIVMHDVEAPWGYQNEIADGSPKEGLQAAINDFLDSHPMWQTLEWHKNCHGLCVLGRR